MKRGFGLISVIIILVLMASLVIFIMKTSFLSIKHTQNSYLQERARIFLRSSIENALLAIEGYKRDTKNKCLRNIEFEDKRGLLKAKIKILRYYCYDLSKCPCDGDLVKKIQTKQSNGYVLMDVTVEDKDKSVYLNQVTLQRP